MKTIIEIEIDTPDQFTLYSEDGEDYSESEERDE